MTGMIQLIGVISTFAYSILTIYIICSTNKYVYKKILLYSSAVSSIALLLCDINSPMFGKICDFLLYCICYFPVLCIAILTVIKSKWYVQWKCLFRFVEYICIGIPYVILPTISEWKKWTIILEDLQVVKSHIYILMISLNCDIFWGIILVENLFLLSLCDEKYS